MNLAGGQLLKSALSTYLSTPSLLACSHWIAQWLSLKTKTTTEQHPQQKMMPNPTYAHQITRSK